MISGPAGGTREGARPQGAMPPGPSVESCESCCHRDSVFTARCTVVHSTVLRSHVVRSSVHPSVCDVGVLGPHRSWKLLGQLAQHLRSGTLTIFQRTHTGRIARSSLR